MGFTDEQDGQQPARIQQASLVGPDVWTGPVGFAMALRRSYRGLFLKWTGLGAPR